MKMKRQMKKVPIKSIKKLFRINISNFFMVALFHFVQLSRHKNSIKNGEQRQVLHIFIELQSTYPF